MSISRRGFLGTGLGAACAALGAPGGGQSGAARVGPTSAQSQPAGTQPAEATFRLLAVGRVEKDKDGKAARLRIFPKYAPALAGLDAWSHCWVLYWFDKNDTPQRRAILQVRPRGNEANPLTGVFACRSPVRPNLIAMSLCQIKSVKNGLVEVADIDAFDGTPILDIKPYTRGPDSPAGQVRTPAWAGR